MKLKNRRQETRTSAWPALIRPLVLGEWPEPGRGHVRVHPLDEAVQVLDTAFDRMPARAQVHG